MKKILSRIFATMNGGDWMMVAFLIAATIGYVGPAIGILMAGFYYMLSRIHDCLNELVKLHKSQLNKEQTQ